MRIGAGISALWCLLFLILLAMCTDSVAGSKGLIDREAFSGFEFNFNNPGARSLGMGGAFVAVADDATAVIANPAGLVILERPELSAEVKFTRFRNDYSPFSNTPAEGATNTFRSRTFEDDVITPSFFSFVYPTDRLVVAGFIREQINFKSTLNSPGAFVLDPTGAGVVQLLPYKSDLEITALNFGLGAGLNLRKENPWLPDIGASVEFSVGHIRSRLERSDFTGSLLATEDIDFTDLGVGFNIGALWRPTKELGIGLVYRRGPRYDGTITAIGITGATSSFPLGLKVPDVVAAGISYRFFDRLTVGFEATYIQYSQLVKRYQVAFADAVSRKFRVDDAVELHIGAEYIFFPRSIPVAVRAGFFTDPDHRIRYTGGPHDVTEAVDRALYPPGKDHYHGTAGVGIVPFPGVQFDFAGNYSSNIREFSISTVFRF